MCPHLGILNMTDATAGVPWGLESRPGFLGSETHRLRAILRNACQFHLRALENDGTGIMANNNPWVVFDYEVDMLRNMCELLRNGNLQYAALSRHVQNAVVESAILHTRNLIDILLSKSKDADDIQLQDLVPAAYESSKLAALQSEYGDRKTANSPCWAFNKKLAHSTKHRTDTYDYSPHLCAVVPLIFKLVDEIEQHRPR
jgi:hypothetical protein